MNDEQLYALLSTEFPTAQTDWSQHEEIPKPPYVVYLHRSSQNIKADNIAYYSHQRYTIELYIRRTDYESENKLEHLLDSAELFWEKDKNFNRELSLYQVNYTI